MAREQDVNDRTINKYNTSYFHIINSNAYIWRTHANSTVK